MVAVMVLFQKETYQDLLLTWTASALRKYSGQQYWRGPIEVWELSLGQRLKIAIPRHFAWIITEPIIILYVTLFYHNLYRSLPFPGRI